MPPPPSQEPCFHTEKAHGAIGQCSLPHGRWSAGHGKTPGKIFGGWIKKAAQIQKEPVIGRQCFLNHFCHKNLYQNVTQWEK